MKKCFRSHLLGYITLFNRLLLVGLFSHPHILCYNVKIFLERGEKHWKILNCEGGKKQHIKKSEKIFFPSQMVVAENWCRGRKKKKTSPFFTNY